MATWGNTLIGQNDFVDNAYNRARAQYDAGKAAAIRQAGRMGINPNSGAFMNMLNQAQYEQTAGANAAANAADAQWLSSAQDQFNRDRAAEMDQQRINNQSNQWWANFGAARNAEKAKYAHEESMFENGNAGGPMTRWGRNQLGPGSERDKYILNPRRPFDWGGFGWKNSAWGRG